MPLKACSEAEKARVTFEEAKTNYERLVRLRENNSVSEQNLDAARSTYENAQSTLRDALAQIRLAERNLSKTAIKAPYDGVISSRRSNPSKKSLQIKSLLHLTAWRSSSLTHQFPVIWQSIYQMTKN